MLRPELGDELIGWAIGNANDVDKSVECLRTSAYSTTGDTIELFGSSIKSIERLRRSDASAFGLPLLVSGTGDASLIGLMLVIDDDREEWRGRTSGGIDDDICRTGGLGGSERSGDVESNDFEISRLLCDTFDGICCIGVFVADVGLISMDLEQIVRKLNC